MPKVKVSSGKKSFKELTKNLEEGQQKGLVSILKKLQDGITIKAADLHPLSIDLAHAPHIFVYQFFRVTRDTVYKWYDSGCPKNADGTGDIHAIHRWLLSREAAKIETTSKSELEARKISKDIELKDLAIQKRKGELIQMDKHQMILGARISALQGFLTSSFIANVHHFQGKTTEELKVVALDFVKQMMGAYLNGSRSIDG